jgi:GNAT superfamily N-acetyltransferase
MVGSRHTPGMSDMTFPVPLPRQRGPVTVRFGSLDEDLDSVHEGDLLWWGRDFVAERVASIPPGVPYAILVAELEGRLVADSFVVGRGVAQNGYAMGGIYVHPQARRRGVGSAMVDALADATAAWGLPGFAGQTHELDADALAAAERMGFERMGHHRESVLDLDSLDVEAAEAAAARAAGAGVELRPLPDDVDDAYWQQLYDEVVEPTWRDAPDSEGAEAMPLQVLRAFFPHPYYVLVAWAGDRPVGVTAVMDRAKDDALNTMFTGVVAGSRGTGLSTALKARHALDMKARGHHRLFTQNMDQNAPILAANDRLGFTVVPGFFAMGCPVPPARST